MRKTMKHCLLATVFTGLLAAQELRFGSRGGKMLPKPSQRVNIL